MESVSQLRIHLLRAMYLLIVVGLSLSTIPEVMAEFGIAADSYSVINVMLLTLVLLSLLGLRYPLKMLPILIFELVWKTVWLLLIALPTYLNQGLDEFAVGVAFACGMGVVLTPLVIPWRYVYHQFCVSKGQAWT